MTNPLATVAVARCDCRDSSGHVADTKIPVWKRLLRLLVTAVCLPVTGFHAGAGETPGLEASFAQPPDSARPGSWLFWMAGNVSEAGLEDCFNALQDTGLTSIVTMQINTYGGRVPEGPVAVLSDEWCRLFDCQMRIAGKKNVATTLFTTETGWSMMGDAKVEPAESSKRLTSTETLVTGDRPIKLPQPETMLDVYGDLAVVAFPDPIGTTHPRPAIENAPAGQPWERLTDNDWRTGVKLPSDDVALVLAYPRPLWVKSLRFWMNHWSARPDLIVVESEDGKGGWREIGRMDTYWPQGYRDVPLVARLEPARAQRFRVTFRNGANALVNGIELTGAVLMDLQDAKAGYTHRREHGGGADLFRASAAKWALRENLPGLDPSKILDLTDKLSPDGSLAWDPPPGRWRVIRVGWTTCGHKAGPSPENVRCYIVDPTGKNAVKDYWSRFPATTLAKHGIQNRGPINAVELDSWEAGPLNWGPDLAQEFRKRRGYSLDAWWPLLATGQVIGDTLASERFLRDYRLTLAELISERYYGETARLARESGVELWAEACGRQQFDYHPAEYLRHAGVPMGEFWLNDGTPRQDCRPASSSAHFYGRSRVAGESFTAVNAAAAFDPMPADMKKLGDEAFIEGINHFMLVVNSVTPYRGPAPGVAAATVGAQMLTGNTWWGKPARGWTDYLTRCQFMLQQGRNVADILYFAGEDFPADLPARADMHPAIPPGLEYDCCGPTELLEHLAVDRDGTLVSSGGARYRFLLLRDWPTMSAEVAEKIRALAGAGAVIIGPPPQLAAGLAGAGKNDDAIRKFASDLWGTADAGAVVDRKTGSGRVLWNKGFDEILASAALPHDFAAPAGRDIRFRHRTGQDFDLYFVSNQEDRPFAGELGFRIAGKRPELWDPLSGKITKPDHWDEAEGITLLSVDLAPIGSVFVVFREAAQPAPAAPPASMPRATSVPGPWKVSFQKERGAPETIDLADLTDLSAYPAPGVKYFSGTATYSSEFQIPNPTFPIFLDLGTVHGVADVAINGKPAANLWCPPYRAEIPDGILKPGKNRIEISVTNSWRNRMIGDEQHPRNFKTVRRAPYEFVNEWPDWYVKGTPRPVRDRISFCTSLFYGKSDLLVPSGLIGPVTIQPLH